MIIKFIKDSWIEASVKTENHRLLIFFFFSIFSIFPYILLFSNISFLNTLPAYVNILIFITLSTIILSFISMFYKLILIIKSRMSQKNIDLISIFFEIINIIVITGLIYISFISYIPEDELTLVGVFSILDLWKVFGICFCLL